MRSVSVMLIIFFSFVINAPEALATDTAPALGQYAPPFELTDLSGKTIRLSEYKGRVVLLHFWSTLCAPCTTELPSLSRLADLFRSAELAVLTVSIDASDKQVKDFMAAHAIGFTVLRDGDKEVFFDQYAGPILPASYLIDRNGIIVQIVAGSREWDAPGMQEEILKLLKKR